MTKEIIIDGVNVAECVRLWNGQCTGKGNILLGNCIDLDCEIKQLKRLEFELKVTRADYEASEQENERLREELKIKENISEDFRKKALEWAEIANNYFKENSRLYKFLQEIKAIAERAFAVCDDDCGNANKFQEIIELTKAEEE